MKAKLSVTYDSGDVVEITTKPADIVRFERTYKVSVAQLGEDVHLEWLMFLAWSALRRTGEGREFDQWADSVASIDTSFEEPQDPLGQAPTTT